METQMTILAGGREKAAVRERRRRFARNVRHALLAAMLLAAAGAAVLALRPQPVPVDVGRAERGKVVVAIEESGTTRVQDRFLVSAPVAGTLLRLSLEAGDVVEEHDSLAELAPLTSPLLDQRTRAEAEARLGAATSALGQARAQVARAAAAKELADQEVARSERLAKNGAISPHELEQAQFALRMREQEFSSAEFGQKVSAEEVRVARVALGRGGEAGSADRHVAVLSPVSGRVLKIHQKSAGVVQAGAPIVEIGDPSRLEVVVDLLTTDAVHVTPGTPAIIKGWGGDHTLNGRVRRIEPSAFTRLSALGVDEQRVNVVIALGDPRERWAALGDGFRVEARLVLFEANDVVKVPLGALFRRGEGWAVFRLADGVAKLTPVQVGRRAEAEAEIVSGLAPGVQVAVHPGDRVKDGVRVEAR